MLEQGFQTFLIFVLILRSLNVLISKIVLISLFWDLEEKLFNEDTFRKKKRHWISNFPASHKCIKFQKSTTVVHFEFYLLKMRLILKPKIIVFVLDFLGTLGFGSPVLEWLKNCKKAKDVDKCLQMPYFRFISKKYNKSKL